MIKQPKISIIIPVYNITEYIGECLQSVMRQTYQGAIECILSDGKGDMRDISARISVEEILKSGAAVMKRSSLTATPGKRFL